MKRSPFAFPAFCPDLSLVVLHHLFAQGQTNAGAGILFPAVQALEQGENFIGQLLPETNAVIAYRKLHVGASAFQVRVLAHSVGTEYLVLYGYQGRLSRMSKLQGIA